MMVAESLLEGEMGVLTLFAFPSKEKNGRARTVMLVAM